MSREVGPTRRATVPSSLWCAPALDAVAILVFVTVGRRNHHLGGGLGWFLTVLWPIAVGWIAGALLTHLYRADRRPWARLLGTLAVTAVVDAVLRGFTGREVVTVFTLVLAGFLGACTFGWRLVALLILRRRAARPAA